MSSEEEDEDFYKTDPETDKMMLLKLARWFPGPGFFNSHEDWRKYRDRVDKVDEQYMKERGLTWDDLWYKAPDGAGTSSSAATAVSSSDAKPQAEAAASTATSEKIETTAQKKNVIRNTEPAKTPEKSSSPAAKSNATKEAVKRSNDSTDGPAWMPPFSHLNGYGGRRSQFLSEEHAKYVAMSVNLQRSGRFRFTGNASLYQSMTEKLKPENEKFNEFVMKSTKTSLTTANNTLPRPVRDFIKDWLEKKKQVANSFTSRYIEKGIHYVTMPMDDPPTLKFCKHLLDVGVAPAIAKPILTTKRTIPMEDYVPGEPRGGMPEFCLSHDPNIRPLCEKYGAEFACGTSAMRCLLLWHGLKLTESCDLPVVVSEKFYEGRRQKLVVISKPLPPRMLSKRQMMTCRAKYAFLEAMKGSNKAADSAGAPPTTSRSIDAPSTSYLGMEDEAMRSDVGSCASADTSFEMETQPFAYGGSLTDTEGPGPDALYSLDDGNTTSKRARHRSVSSSQKQLPMDESDVMGGIMATMSTPAKKNVGFSMEAYSANRGELGPIEDFRGYSVPNKPNCMRQYLLFNLKEFGIVVRSNVDGIESPKGRPNTRIRASVSSKVEYQPMFGAEQQTDAEIVYDLWTGYLKNSDQHLRCRVKYEDDYDILALDVVTREMNSPSLPSTFMASQMVSTGMRRLHIVLSELRNLTSGAYMLRFSAVDQKRFTILKAVQTQDRVDDDLDLDGFESSDDAGLDVKQAIMALNYNRVPNVATFEECWRKIDSEAVLQWHRIAKRIPAAFPPRKPHEKAKWDGKQPQKKWKKKRKNQSPRRGRPARMEQESADDGTDSMQTEDNE